ncbi:PDR/VanB family oxidoreductase [Streptomyces sp. NPDC017941]|uniref:PDR/VanB family oxidoreductase n=1 Tax=Streptomyces sp. NPDC017941 TaxID=3365018 RepID=UPI00378BAAC6
MPLPRPLGSRAAHNALALTGAALLARRALRRRTAASPLWPLPALAEPVSGQPRTRALRLLVARHERVADGVVRLRLESTSRAPLPSWEPGAHLDLVLPSGLVRQYSLCGDPGDTSSYTVATRLIGPGDGGRGGSREVHEALAEGMEVEVRGPRNRFPLIGDAASYTFVAGGIGITPVLAMARAVDAAGADWRLLYCGRSRAAMPFLAELEELGGAAGRVRVVAEDESGRPDVGAFLGGAAAPAGAVYVCGPEGLMDAAARALPEGCSLHLERFAPAASAGGDSAFEVELRRSGRTVAVGPGTTVLAAVRAELPGLAYSCEQGFCGTCQHRVLEGEIDHRDELLTDGERADSMLICVSRALGPRLVLDL